MCIRDRLQAEADRITPITPITPVFPDDPADFRPGDTVLAQTSVRVRRSPGFVGKDESDTLAALSPGESALIVGPREVRDGLTWWLVRLTTAEGLVVEGWAAQATAEAVLLATVCLLYTSRCV